MIDPATANDFILGYKDFLLFAAGAAGNDQKGEFFDELAFGRNALLVDPGLLSQFRAESAEKHEPVFLAIANRQVSDWIYLRDTSRYYVFIKADQRSACAVRGLTETVKKASPSGGPFLFDRNVSPVRFEGATHKRVSFAKHPQDAQNAVASDSGPGGVRAKPESSCRARHIAKGLQRKLQPFCYVALWALLWAPTQLMPTFPRPISDS